MKTPSMKAISAAMLCCYFMSVLGCGRSGRASPPGGVDAVAPPPSLPERFADLRSTALAECGAAEVTRVDNLTNVQVMNYLKESGTQTQAPDNLLGYGIPNFKKADALASECAPQKCVPVTARIVK